jgi:hypothetical protein
MIRSHHRVARGSSSRDDPFPNDGNIHPCDAPVNVPRVVNKLHWGMIRVFGYFISCCHLVSIPVIHCIPPIIHRNPEQGDFTCIYIINGYSYSVVTCRRGESDLKVTSTDLPHLCDTSSIRRRLNIDWHYLLLPS